LTLGRKINNITGMFGTRRLRSARLLVVLLTAVIAPTACRPRNPRARETAVPVVETSACVPLARRESVLRALDRLDLSPAARAAIVEHVPGFATAGSLAASGESLLADYRNAAIRRFEYRRRYDQTWTVDFDSGAARFASRYHWVRVEPRVVSGAIQSSLWGSMIRIGQKPDMVMTFADLFAWDIDFFTETQAGDSFKFITEQTWCDDRPVGKPQLHCGQYKGKCGEYYGYWYQDPTGYAGFYTRKGEAVRKGFLRSPLKFSRVSSHFSSGRYHPILRYVRPHQGIDYAAPTGTPVSTVGDGLITQCGWSGGYGRLVQISHGSGYVSRYGHLSRFGKIRAGQRVGQGTVIGYVGSTGISTGPHLHFELRVNGVPRNPLKIIPPRAPPVPARFLTAFRARADSLANLLHSAQPTPEDKTAPADSIRTDTSTAPADTGW
jgi:murein DD-endopeptidase MepM/ murein hydrolase activator NlpD